MAHFAKLNEDNIVEEVVVVNNDVLDKENEEQSGIAFLHSLYNNNAIWIQTSYNGNIRKNYAGIGYTYDEARDAFIPPKPYESWLLDEESCLWKAPVSYPTDGNLYVWNEENQSWDLQEEIGKA
jgi:hypothetical protein